MSGMSDLSITLREIDRDLRTMGERLQLVQERMNSVLGEDQTDELDPVSTLLAQEKMPDQLYEWLQEYTHTASAQSIGCEYVLLGAKLPTTTPQLRLIEMDGTFVTELDSWDQATGVNYGTAIRMMGTHVEQDLNREQMDGDDPADDSENDDLVF